MTKSATVKLQKWGNGLAVRIPASVARAAHFTEGLPVEVSADAAGLTIRPAGTFRPTLAEKLALFDPARHGGEAMGSAPVDAEAMPSPAIRRSPLDVLRGSVVRYDDPAAPADAEWDAAR
ncbi:AbrB/MazE/SpoVT family DNA-binding domain-containing protein [Cupriavidus sp. USMAA2-4]|uniref:AbrB/MazE/SpoVT family DNA-binding domain-containing protein n=1 Tax=Cupriavidus sp. USMAA2-4 TaxID=876364 RepID=UPI000A0212DE|nr:AbrB/MazE/SpoVT family DNA-binding domain-containing protein [Cupriavidus sp. USMAA2-4]